MHPNPDARAPLLSYVATMDAATITMAEFISPRFPMDRIGIIPHAIEALSTKNLPLEEGWPG